MFYLNFVTELSSRYYLTKLAIFCIFTITLICVTACGTVSDDIVHEVPTIITADKQETPVSSSSYDQYESVSTPDSSKVDKQETPVSSGSYDQYESVSTPDSSKVDKQETPISSGTDHNINTISIVLGDGSKARYLVKEQLVRRNLPNDAIGVTNDVYGMINILSDGKVDAVKSKISVNLSALKSDSSRRDQYVANNTLDTVNFPTADLVIKSIPDLPWPIPVSGNASFDIIADLTIRDVTKEIVWSTNVEFGEVIRGTSKTNFQFEKFDLKIPKVFVVLSVDNDIRLEIDFQATINEQ